MNARFNLKKTDKKFEAFCSALSASALSMKPMNKLPESPIKIEAG